MPINAYFRPRLKVAAMKPFDFFHLRPPEDARPLYPILSVWAAIQLPSGRWIFPTIEPPNTGSLTIRNIGLDFDGSVIGMVSEGPETGKTLVTYPALTKKGKIKKISVH